MEFATLATIWFVLWALLWAVYFVLDGFDLGLGVLLPFLGGNEEETNLIAGTRYLNETMMLYELSLIHI